MAMIKSERKKELLKWFIFSRIKNDSSFAILMKKTGSNGKGYLDRYFVLHRNYILYYKPGKLDGRPDDNQEPQGYINLGDCILEETKAIFKTQPLTFQIASKSGRTYNIRGKDERTIEQFLQLIRPRIKSLNQITQDSLGNIAEHFSTITTQLPKTMKLPDRVKPDVATKWIVEMKDYNDAYDAWEPWLMKLEQFSEHCHGETKNYIDWFVSSDGPRLSMIRCEELVLDNWVDFIKKTASEIHTYEETRHFREDYDDIIQHVRNMAILVDSYNLFMRECHKSVKHVDKFLEEKQIFQQYVQIYSKAPSRHSISFNNTDTTPGKIEPSADLALDAEAAALNSWFYMRNTLYCGPSGDDARSDSKLGSSGEIDEWRFGEGVFVHKKYGQVLWNNRTWIWSHAKTDYRIRFDWDAVNQSFVFYQPNSAKGALQSTLSAKKLSVSRKPFPTTVYADWKYANNMLTAVVLGSKTEPPIKCFQSQGYVPIPTILIAAMLPHIKSSLEQLDIIGSA
ncbi:hypothetical protein SAMD00019534_029670, partial [Acytostelium subglobosum LB1]|uniref:hypothetical protein n=1 Tax=Acytostelium subglobosum LB1 TaxID=1410327 RepID=UPI0006448EEF